jgi:peptidoglycan/xylan/chitin deacetylase (PgdA/CDA1 family)
MDSTLKIAFLIGRDDAVTQDAIAQVCQNEGVQPVAVLLDTQVISKAGRWRNLKRNIGREGITYPFHRAVYAIGEKLEDWAERVIPKREVEQLLRDAFPDRGLDRLAEKYGFRVFKPGNLNAPEAIETLRSAGVDLGIVLGTRVLKKGIFSVPRLGCINLHKGAVPEYRGTVPGFWELYDGRESAGVTVHFVDDGLDTGDIVGTCEIPIHAKETPDSLHRKLDVEGNKLLASVVQQIAEGTHVSRPQPKTSHKARLRPTRVQTDELARRLPHWRRTGGGREAIKTAAWLFVFHSGIFALVKFMHRSSRGAILLYHRVNDISTDVLTTNTQRFAEHLVTLRHYYRVVNTSDMVERVAKGERIEPTSVAIHFDDCYRDVRECAAPLLAAADMPAVAFISSGFVDTERFFAHDEMKYPHQFPNLRSSDVGELPAMGVGVAAHTVNHVDLGQVTLEQAEFEVLESRRQLELITSHPVLLFSFPFGGVQNIRDEVRTVVMEAGYRALFSAHGGFVGKKTKLSDIPRFGVSSDHSPLALLMEIEGISFRDFKRSIKERMLFWR